MVYLVEDMNDFQKQLSDAGDKLVIVDFFAAWCGPCKMIAPELEKISESDPDVVVLKIDVDECEDIAAKYSVTAMPTFIFFKKSQKLDEFSGANVTLLKTKIAALK